MRNYHISGVLGIAFVQNLLSQKAFAWVSIVEPLSDNFVATHHEALHSALDVADFSDEDDNSCLLLFNDMMKEDSLQSGSLLSEIFAAELASAATNVQILVNTLDLLKFYNYDDLRPFSQLIAAAALRCRFERVKAHALSLIGHWGDRRALDLLNNLNPGSNTFVCGMYASIKGSLERLCC